MTITEAQVSQISRANNDRGSPEGAAPEQAARNRELIKAIKTINDGGSLGSSNELRFGFDRDTGQALIKIVDRVTNEVITQLPPESALRTAQVLKELNSGEHLA